MHLLNNDDTDDDNELHLVKHSAYYGENKFSKMLSNKAGMSILSGNIQSINAKFDEFSSFINRLNTHNPISTILLQECWIDDNAIDSLALINLKEYNMMSDKLGHLSKRLCNRKRTKSFPQNLLGMIGLPLILTRLLINLRHIL